MDEQPLEEPDALGVVKLLTCKETSAFIFPFEVDMGSVDGRDAVEKGFYVRGAGATVHCARED
jgi:hypothetical protein